MQGIIFQPESSKFFVAAKNEWESKGKRKMKSAMSEYETFEVQIPGYYGDRGSVVIYEALREQYVVEDAILDDSRSAPLDKATFIRRVLLPEIAMRLIMEDEGLSSLEEAREVMEKSRDFGRAVWPD
ncbi:hypothetical protein BT69DRAFT_1198648, partial [Atractiella rhizophila]